MQAALYCREISGGGRDRVWDRDAVTATGAAYASDDGVVAPLTTTYRVVADIRMLYTHYQTLMSRYKAIYMSTLLIV
jgi:hypothetical protein